METESLDPDSFAQRLACTSKQTEALDLCLHHLDGLGFPRAAFCQADPAAGGRLVVRLSRGMEGASNKVLKATAAGASAAELVYRSGERLRLAEYTPGGDIPTDLEAWLGIERAFLLCVAAPSASAPWGVAVAVCDGPGRAAPKRLEALCAAVEQLAAHLARLEERRRESAAAPPSARGSRLADLGRALQECVDAPSLESLSDRVLDHCRAFTGAEFGFAGYVDPETGFLLCPTMTRDIYHLCRVAGKTVVFEKPSGVGGWVLDSRTAFFTNDPSAHPRSVGTPPGHVPLRQFLGAPCFSGDRIVGMLALANKTAGFEQDDLDLVNTFGAVYAAGITRFLSERNLATSRDRFSELYHNAPCGYHTHDGEGTLLEMNNTERLLLGLGAEEPIEGLRIIDLLHPQSVAAFLDHLQQLRAGMQAGPVELLFRTRGGRPLIALYSATGAFDERGFLLKAHGMVVDVTREVELRRAAEVQLRTLNQELEQRVEQRTRQLTAANHELEAFAYSVSHDLRAPVRAICGFSQMLTRQYAEVLDARGIDYLNRVHRAGLRMNDLIDDLLSLSRISGGELCFAPLNLSALVQEIAEELRQAAPERQVEWRVREEVQACADARLMRVAMQNLLGNAWKFTANTASARIEFDLAQCGEEPAFCVRDNGAGFDMEFAARLFGAFQRLHKQEEFEGNGIGLATVQRIVHRHGGRVWAEGAVGEGASFYFTLGALPATPAAGR